MGSTGGDGAGHGVRGRGVKAAREGWGRGHARRWVRGTHGVGWGTA